MKFALSAPLNFFLFAVMITPVVMLFFLDDDSVLRMLRILSYINFSNIFFFVLIPLFTPYKNVLGDDSPSWVDILTYAPAVFYGFEAQRGVTLQEFLTGKTEQNEATG
ncbi:MAG: hypothetical protein H6850_02260 [Alphaproteobacteria bacterium]|nr:MAG: hypothetical protein H6850_02260 [Alphaproteobacteria bacterium]